MRIERDLKLTFDDVLIRPKRSTLISRSDVNLVREFTFRHTEETWDGVPIVAANMDTTGLFSIAENSTGAQNADLHPEVLLYKGVLRCLGERSEF